MTFFVTGAYISSTLLIETNMMKTTHYFFLFFLLPVSTFNNGTKSRYGFGWNVYHRDNGDTVMRHAGQFVGYLSIITRNITRKETIILLTNVTGKGDVINLVTLMTQIENILENKKQP